MKTSRPILLGFLILLQCLSALAQIHAAPLDEWRFRNPLPTGYALYDATYGNGQFVAVGDGGFIATSADGLTWVVRKSETTNALLRVNWANDLFVAVGQRNTILTSADGVDWTRRTPDGSTQLKSVTFGGGLHVVVGSEGVLVSPDGMQWTPQGARVDLLDVAYGNGTFVATSQATGIHTSPDGMTWTAHEILGGAGPAYRVTFGNGQFVVTLVRLLHFGPSPELIVSANGLDWQRVLSPLVSLQAQPLEFLGSEFVLAALDGTAVAVSADGMVWTNHPTSLVNGASGLAFGAGRYLLVGGDAGWMISPNLMEWSINPFGLTPTLTDYAMGNGAHVAVGGLWILGIPSATYLTEKASLWSSNGLSFSNSNATNSEPLSSVAFGSGTFVAVGKSGDIERSLDGRSWTKKTSGTTQNLYDIVYGNGLFVAVGEQGALITSPTGGAWTTRSSGTGVPLYGITFGSEQFVAVGYQGVVVTSPDGLNWTVQDSETLANLYSVTFDEHGFVAVGSGGTIVTSTNAVHWTGQTVPTSADLRSVAHGLGHFVAVGTFNQFELHGPSVVLSSTNGVHWELRPLYAPFHFYGTVFTGDSFVVVGSGGVILESGSLTSVRLLGRFLAGAAGFEVIAEGQAGRSVRLQARDEISAGQWSDLTLFDPFEGRVSYVDTNPPASTSRFYRAVSP